jgi:membrane protein
MSAWGKLLNLSPVRLVTTTVNEFNKNNGNLMAAAVSFNLLFSLFPFALAMISVAGFVMESSVFEGRVINAMANLIPVARNLITTTLQGVVNARAATGILAILGFIWSASAFFGSVRSSLNSAWGIKNDSSFFEHKLIAIIMTLCSFVLLIIYIWLSTGVRLMHMANLQIEELPFVNSTAVFRIIFAFLSGLLAFAVILLLYRFMPAVRPRWRDVWAGALLAAAGFEIVRVIFIWYVKNFSTYNLVYGPVGSVIALLMFIYLTAWVLLFFARFCAVKARSPNATT